MYTITRNSFQLSATHIANIDVKKIPTLYYARLLQA